MRIQLHIIGQPTSTEEAKATVRGAPLSGRKIQDETHLLDTVEVLGAYDVRPTARGEKDAPVQLDAEEDDIIEFVLEDGVSMWMSVAAYRDRQYRLKPQLKRTAGLDIGPLIPGVPASRGVLSDIATGAVRILRLKRDEIWEQAKDPAQWPAWVKQQGITTFEQLGSWLTAKLIIWRIENKIRPEEGLYRWVKSSDENASSLIPPAGIPSDQPLLLFIHGTASNTQGSFGALHGDDASSEWQTLTQTFKGQIYAFEHRTMSQSPIDNALVLANALPDGARLTIVTHSRGGQVADLLCLKELLSEQIGRFGRKGGTANEADQHDQTQLTELAKVLRKKRFQVQRVIRVACPSQGTLLASENLDRFLSVVTSLIGLIPVVGQSPVYQVIKRITLETAKRRWDPSVIPGIESMIPQSPLVALLNAPDVQGAGDLGVIAGDIEGGVGSNGWAYSSRTPCFTRMQTMIWWSIRTPCFRGSHARNPPGISSIKGPTSPIFGTFGMPEHAIYWLSLLRVIRGLQSFGRSKKPRSSRSRCCAPSKRDRGRLSPWCSCSPELWAQSCKPTARMCG